MYPIGFTTMADYLERHGFRTRIVNLAGRGTLAVGSHADLVDGQARARRLGARKRAVNQAADVIGLSRSRLTGSIHFKPGMQDLEVFRLRTDCAIFFR